MKLKKNSCKIKTKNKKIDSFAFENEYRRDCKGTNRGWYCNVSKPEVL